MEKLDRKLLNQYLKPLVQNERALSNMLIDRLCLRLRTPSLAMELECSSKIWIEKLRRNSYADPSGKVRQHAKDSLNAITKLHQSTIIRTHYTKRSGNKHKIMLHEFKAWNTQLAPSKQTSRTVDKVTKLAIENDVLDSPCLSAEEIRSGYRYVVYRFPSTTKLSPQEDKEMLLLLKQDPSHKERKDAIVTLKAVHLRDSQETKAKELREKERKVTEASLRNKEAEAATALLSLSTQVEREQRLINT